MIAPMAPVPDLRALPAAEAVAAALPHAWVVGGAVRDLLLGVGASVVDLDLVIEGDAVAAAQRLGEALGGSVTVHDRFGTATVAAGGHVYDLATARAESYARPGALPDVRPGTLEEDLLRRDFTVNAIAVSFDGRVAAAPHAFEDLDARVLRVLHERSFLDDPTRLLRLVRYATRLGFAVEVATAALASAAVAGGALATVTPARIGGELRLLLREPSAVEALAWVAGVAARRAAGVRPGGGGASACAAPGGRSRGPASARVRLPFGRAGGVGGLARCAGLLGPRAGHGRGGGPGGRHRGEAGRGSASVRDRRGGAGRAGRGRRVGRGARRRVRRPRVDRGPAPREP